jgi:hypothetical protein
MRVRLCSRCPYAPRDLAGHYDPEGVLHVCAKCDGERGASTNYYPRKVHRRQRCPTTTNILGITKPGIARFATDGLASYGITHGEPRFVQRSALTASRHARKATADGYVDLTPPDGEEGAASILISGFWSKEPVQ